MLRTVGPQFQSAVPDRVAVAGERDQGVAHLVGH